MIQANGLQIVTRLDSLLAEKGETRAIMCSHLAITPQTVSHWYTRGSIPKADDALRIADYLGVSPWWLVFGEEKPEAGKLPASDGQVSPEDKKLLEEWQALTAEEKASIQILLDGYTSRREESEAAKKA